MKSENARNAQNLFTCIAVCHTAIVSTKKGQNGEFICDSEDEFTLLNAVKQIGFRFIKRDFPYIYLKVFGINLRFEFKGLLPFDPIRKIMSVIVMTDDGEWLLFAKGADSMMLKRITGLTDQKLEKIQSKVNSFAAKSLRTMVMAMRKLD